MDGRPLPPAILVPIHNAAAEVDDCIAALLAHTPAECRMLLLEDASPDPAVDAVLSGYQHHAKIEIHRNAKNLGFTRTVNLGMEMAGGADVRAAELRHQGDAALAGESEARGLFGRSCRHRDGALQQCGRVLRPRVQQGEPAAGVAQARRLCAARHPRVGAHLSAGPHRQRLLHVHPARLPRPGRRSSTPRLFRAATARRTISACARGASAGRM